MHKTDQLFNRLSPGQGRFAFDENVAEVFDDMISRSVPLYDDLQRALPGLVGRLTHDPLKIVDLGCSTGTSLVSIARGLSTSMRRKVHLIGVDNSRAMLARCHEKIEASNLDFKVELVDADIARFRFENASAVLMNYTLQFVRVPDRLKILQQVAASMKPGGLLILSEKVRHADEATDAWLVELYFDYKRRRGYSELEIARKRDALENVLVPQTVQANEQLLRDAGFTRVEVLLKWFNFATFVCRMPTSQEKSN